jgi:hypothetical protein
MADMLEAEHTFGKILLDDQFVQNCIYAIAISGLSKFSDITRAHRSILSRQTTLPVPFQPTQVPPT